MEIFQVWKLLVSRKLLIYQVRNMCYFIGGSVVRECNANEANLYVQLKEELSFLRATYKDLSLLSPKDVRELSQRYEAIKDICQRIEWNSDITEDGKQLCSFLSALSQKEVCEIAAQVNDYITINNLSDECFYRESKEYKKTEENQL